MVDRRRIVVAAVTVLAVVAVGAAAATIQSDANAGQGGVQSGGDADTRSGSEDEDEVLPTLGDVAPWGSDERGGSGDGADDERPGDDGGLVDRTVVRSPAMGFAALLGVAAVLAAVAYRFGRGDDADPTTEPSEAEAEADDEGSLAAVGRAAGRAVAGASPESSPENVIERAWRDMTAELSVDSPQTATPTEFAEAAVDAGLREEDVRELTSLFEKVRYGDADPTEDRRERATAALRRIERRYGP